MDGELNELANEVMNLRNSTTLNPEVEDFVNQKQDEIQEDLDRFRKKGAFRRFLLEYIDQAYREYRDEDSARERPLCTCSSPSCDLKDGKIPSTLELSESIRTGFMDFRQQHRGDPIILREARDEWRSRVRKVKKTLRQVIAVMRKNEVPEKVEMG